MGAAASGVQLAESGDGPHQPEQQQEQEREEEEVDLDVIGNEAKRALISRDAVLLGKAVKQILGNASKAFLEKVMAEAVPCKTEGGPLRAGGGEAAAAPSLLTLPQLSLQTPRGRFDVHLGRRGLSFLPPSRGAQVVAGLTEIPWSDVRIVIRVPKLDAAQKANTPVRAYYIVLALQKPFQVGKQHHSCVVFNVDGVKPYPHLGSLKLQEVATETDAAMISKWQGMLSSLQAQPSPQAEHETLGMILKQAAGKDHIEEPDIEMSPCPYFKVYRGVDEGGLYPLRTGLLFLPKPALYIPSDDIRRIATGREGKVHCAAVYTEIQIQLGVGDAQETFGNFPKCEVPQLMAYAAKLAERARAERLSQGDIAGVMRAFQEDDEEADRDFEPESDSDEYVENSYDSEDDVDGSKRKTPEKSTAGRSTRAKRRKQTPAGRGKPPPKKANTSHSVGAW
mmetsp:Transcript_19242/g.41348  ORF Transcript_19242/g.41348 Transcript_19242/m.41348 type:complete len:451 (-) Transcript_19242:544-1896(-)